MLPKNKMLKVGNGLINLALIEKITFGATSIVKIDEETEENFVEVNFHVTPWLKLIEVNKQNNYSLVIKRNLSGTIEELLEKFNNPLTFDTIPNQFFLVNSTNHPVTLIDFDSVILLEPTVWQDAIAIRYFDNRLLNYIIEGETPSKVFDEINQIYLTYLNLPNVPTTDDIQLEENATSGKQTHDQAVPEMRKRKPN